MALDRPDDFEAGDDRHVRHGDQHGDIPAARSGPAETRTREEYYEVLRAADGRAADAGHDAADGRHEADGPRREADGPRREANGSRHEADGPRAGPSGWDSVDESERPPLDALRVSDERRAHILDGDPGGGGGHRHGVGKPGKTEFPASWDDEKIIGTALDVVRRPDSSPVLQHWNNRWICSGTRDSVEVSVIVLRGGEVWTAWPEEGCPGVVRNPKKGKP